MCWIRWFLFSHFNFRCHKNTLHFNCISRRTFISHIIFYFHIKFRKVRFLLITSLMAIVTISIFLFPKFFLWSLTSGPRSSTLDLMGVSGDLSQSLESLDQVSHFLQGLGTTGRFTLPLSTIRRHQKRITRW